MGVLLQEFFKMPPNLAVPSPADGDPSVASWWDHVASQANELRQAGFTAVWLPPVLKTSDGTSRVLTVYGPFDDYDIGSKKQKSAFPTRFGTREQLQRSVAVLRANGLDVYLDMVEHQRVGDTTPFEDHRMSLFGRGSRSRWPTE
jgi:alpha-amylase